MKPMKLFTGILLILMVILFSSSFGFCSRYESTGEIDKNKPPSQGRQIIDQMTFKPIEFNIPKVGREVERVVLPNGIVLFVMEDKRLPQISVRGLIPMGSRFESRENYGISRLTAEVLRTGGTKNLSSDELNKEIEFIAASIESAGGRDFSSIYLNVISRQQDRGLELLADIIKNPAFDQKQIELSKSHIREQIRRKNDQQRDIVRREFNKIVYGNHPYGFEPEWDVIKNITREDMIKWYDTFYTPENMMFAVVGDFDKTEIIEKLTRLLGDMPKKGFEPPLAKSVKDEFTPGIYIAERDVNQSFVQAGHLGVDMKNPDIFAIELMDYIMGGGGFNSYMTSKIRSDEGLAYMIFSFFLLNTKEKGTAGVVFSTKSNTTIKAIELMLQVMKKMQQEEVPEAHLQWAKDSIINGFVFEFSSSDKQVQNLMSLEFYGLPSDFYENYVENINKITAQDIKKAANKYLHPDKMTIVIAGKSSDFEKSPDSLGFEVHTIKLEDFKE